MVLPPQDQFDSIDLSDNAIVRLEGFPRLPRLKMLLLNNNRIAKVARDLEGEGRLALCCVLRGMLCARLAAGPIPTHSQPASWHQQKSSLRPLTSSTSKRFCCACHGRSSNGRHVEQGMCQCCCAPGILSLEGAQNGM